MDIPIPDPVTTTKALSPGFAAHLVERLAAAMPAGADPQASRELFEALAPKDAADAVLATLAIAAAQAGLDNFARAARPGISDDTAIRLRGGGLAATRVYSMAMRTLRRQQEPAATPQPSEAAPARVSRTRPAPAPVREPQEAPARAMPVEPVEMFQPRDRFGQPIPDWRTDLMTRAQFRASLAWPRDPALEAAALAEEEAMIAEQKALEAAEANRAATPPPDLVPQEERGPGPVSPPGGR